MGAQKDLLDRLGTRHPVIFDVGAHRGSTTARYRAAFPESRIFCFEPFPASSEVLKQRHQNDPSIEIIPLAVSNTPGTRTFYVNGFDAAHSLLPRPKKGRRYYPKHAGPDATIEVQVTTVDEFVRQRNLERVDVLKLDIQGGELMALHGAVDTINHKGVGLIYTEILFVELYADNPLFHEICAFLASLGFSLFSLYHLRTASNGQLRFGDALFVSREIRQKVIDRYEEEP
jgi:FkbM family methyltransferase